MSPLRIKSVVCLFQTEVLQRRLHTQDLVFVCNFCYSRNIYGQHLSNCECLWATKKYLVYSGEKKRIEWYFDDRGKSVAKRYYEELEEPRRKKLRKLFRLMGDEGEIWNTEKFIHEGDGIYAFKTHEDRFLCFFCIGAKVIVTNAYDKKGQKMPPGEKERALRAMNDFTQRTKRGEYYEKDDS
jgi:phage-related protein